LEGFELRPDIVQGVFLTCELADLQILSEEVPRLRVDLALAQSGDVVSQKCTLVLLNDIVVLDHLLELSRKAVHFRANCRDV
jgi:hypothetical protein